MLTQNSKKKGKISICKLRILKKKKSKLRCKLKIVSCKQKRSKLWEKKKGKNPSELWDVNLQLQDSNLQWQSL